MFAPSVHFLKHGHNSYSMTLQFAGGEPNAQCNLGRDLSTTALAEDWFEHRAKMGQVSSRLP